MPREPAPNTTMRGALAAGVGAGREERRGRRMRLAGLATAAPAVASSVCVPFEFELDMAGGDIFGAPFYLGGGEGGSLFELSI